VSDEHPLYAPNQPPARTCHICHGSATVSWNGARHAVHVECEVCGSYLASSDLYERLRDCQVNEALLPYLSAHVRQATDAGEEAELTTENWEQFARGRMSVPVSQRLQRLMELVAARSSVGEWLAIDNQRKLLASLDMKDQEELDFVLAHLHASGLMNRGWVGGRSDGQGGETDTKLGLQLTVTGWNAVAPIGSGVPGTCFVAMSFHASLNTAFSEGIVPAVETDCGLRVLRVDRVHHNDNITDRIIGGIRTAQFLIADFTLQRQGVYYEAGFAQGLGRQVIRTCRATDFDKLHFDTRQFFHLKWNEPADLRAALADHIRATVGDARRRGGE